MAEVLEKTTLGELVAKKKGVVSVPDTATVQDVLFALLENNVTAVPIAGSAIDGIGELVQYIGIVSVLDVLLHIADNLGQPEKDLGILAVNIIGQSDESRTLYTLSPNTKVSEAMNLLRNGVHRFLVELEGSVAAKRGAAKKQRQPELGLLTQTDIVRFLVQNAEQLGPVGKKPVAALGLLEAGQSPPAVPSNMPLVDVIRLMRSEGGLTAIAVVGTMNGITPGSNPRPVRGGKVIGQISATDFRGLTPDTLRSLTDVTVEEFLKSMPGDADSRPPVTCRPCTPLASVMSSAIESKVHRVWVTNEDGWLSGVVTFSDMIRAVRDHYKEAEKVDGLVVDKSVLPNSDS